MLSTAPTQSRSSVFMIRASCAMPFHTPRSPVSFQYIYANDDFVPAPSACMMLQYSGSPPKMSGMILQKAWGNRPLSMFFMALCTSSFAAETPRIMYLWLLIDENFILLRAQRYVKRMSCANERSFIWSRCPMQPKPVGVACPCRFWLWRLFPCLSLERESLLDCK